MSIVVPQLLDFNSHAHVERDVFAFIAENIFICISTHTLTWSVTCCQGRDTDERNFNSHAHVERDVAFLFYGGGTMNFNSHAHVERDT